MHQYDDPSAVAELPDKPAGATAGFFFDGDLGQGQQATILRAWFLNMIQAEFLGVLEVAEIDPDREDDGQLAAAIVKLITAAIASIPLSLGAWINVNTALSVGGFYRIDTSAGSVLLTLPAAPANHAVIRLKDVAGSWGAFPPVLAGNGKTIEGYANLNLNQPAFDGIAQYSAATGNWSII